MAVVEHMLRWTACIPAFRSSFVNVEIPLELHVRPEPHEEVFHEVPVRALMKGAGSQVFPCRIREQLRN